MSDTFKCEVCVVGAGPAGCTVAAELAGRGVDVVLIERENVPRPKCCAGGLSVASRELIACDVSEAVECDIKVLSVSSVEGREASWHEERPFMFTVAREVLDASLFTFAASLGTRVVEGQCVLTAENGADGVHLACSGCEVDARIVVCADGAKGTTARQLGIAVKKDVALGIANIVQKPAGWRRGDDEVQLILGLARETYGWVFPRDNYLSVGIECHDLRVDWRAAVDRLFRHLGLEDVSVTAECAHPIPSLRKPYQLTGNRSMVVGDAAGFCDPLTGEGIRNALLSARLAADVLAVEVKCAEPDIRAYEQEVRKCLIPEIESGGRLLAAVKLLGATMLPGLRDENRIGRGCARLLRGETTYTGLLSSALGISGIVRILSEGLE